MTKKILIQLSDCHIDDDDNGVQNQKNLRKIINAVGRKNYDAMLITGDLSHRGSEKSYRILRAILAVLEKPLYIIRGNHDDKSNLEKYFAAHLFRDFKIGKWRVVALETVRENRVDGYLRKNVLQKFTEMLNRYPNDYVVVALHHPPVRLKNWNNAQSLKNPDDFFATADRHLKIKAVVWGHAHQSSAFQRRHIRLYSCPSTARQFDGEKRIGYREFELWENGRVNAKTRWI